VSACNNNGYLLLLRKSSIQNLHPNTNGIKECYFIRIFFSFKEAQENHSLKRMIKGSLSSHHQSKDNEIEFRSKNEKMTKTFGPNFLTYLLKNESQTYSNAMSCPKLLIRRK
jgi:hypothetical protein